MSAPSIAAQAPRSSDTPLKRKMAGLPVWAWAAVAAAVVVAVVAVVVLGGVGGSESWSKALEGTWTHGKATVVITDGPGKTASLKIDFGVSDYSPTSFSFDGDTLTVNQFGEPEHYRRTSGGSGDFTGQYTAEGDAFGSYGIKYKGKTLTLDASEPTTFTLTDDGKLFVNRLFEGEGGVTLSKE